jgi:L-aspartate oxidase
MGETTGINITFAPTIQKILMRVIDFDAVIIGSGLSGLTAAYHSAKYGSVAIVTKSELDTSNSYFAQGGVAAALADDDSPEFHLNDTLIAGRGLCDSEPVKILVYEGRDRIREIIEMGMKFDSRNGKIVFGLEGGHSKRRILHAGGDATGKELTSFMLKKVQALKAVKPFEYTAAVRLVKKNNRVAGVQAIDFRTGENILLKSKSIILATGGLSRLYARSTNPFTATGDGIALAYEAGAKIADIEFIQFHPSALLVPGEEAFLISEAVRGEGAWLLDENGNRFMPGLHPLAELAPRDVVAHSIYQQILKSKSGKVFLSLKHLDPDKIKRRFSTICKKLKEYGFDMATDNLPVAPAAHYMAGGILSGLNGETNVPGLYVCGETASTGVMGANRLASNSLTECLVFGKRVGQAAAQAEKVDLEIETPPPVFVNHENETAFLEYKNEIAGLMSANAAVVRNRQGLEQSKKRLGEILDQFSDFKDEYNFLKIKNAAQVGFLIANAALSREESRGSHIREDFENLNPGFQVHLIQQKGKGITSEKVRS